MSLQNTQVFPYAILNANDIYIAAVPLRNTLVTIHPGQLSLAVASWVGAVSSGHVRSPLNKKAVSSAELLVWPPLIKGAVYIKLSRSDLTSPA